MLLLLFEDEEAEEDSGKAEECFRFSAPDPEPWLLGKVATDWRKAEGGVRGAGRQKRTKSVTLVFFAT